eukprot:CAMPEP_0182877312 /NCGR_PEP_ID=MMETSP0034_2-20130328/14677_1 /TAXON_ID=156128 /ORGANISM="Nephroselmis pyriformis, Strain CCMP717" /LENGTH=116 /DNA_ID=CAMNT_0025010145 /DNA_START=1 /DNA_END=347 /DNA_ORIENTATION=+
MVTSSRSPAPRRNPRSSFGAASDASSQGEGEGSDGQGQGEGGEGRGRRRRASNEDDHVREPFQMKSLEGAYVLPLVEHAMWSSNFEVKRDAVAGLAALAKTEENKEILGRMGALTS